MRIAVLAILLAISIMACAPQESPEPMQPAPGREPVNAQVPPSAAQTKQAAQTTDTGVLERPNAETEKLFANSANVKSYSFDVAFLPDKNAKYTYFVKGDKAKVVLQDPLLFPDKTQADVVFLDFTQKTAFAHCTKGRAYCDDPTRAKAVNYADYELILPDQWIEKLSYGTKTRSLTFLNVPVNVVQYEAEGKWYEGYVHNYYGIPLRVAIANDKEMTDIIGGYEYRSMAFNVVKDTDVNPPQ